MKTFMKAVLITCLIGFYGPLAAQDMFESADYNGNDILLFSEVTAIFPRVTKIDFDRMDLNADGVLDFDEYSLAYSQGFLRRGGSWGQ